MTPNLELSEPLTWASALGVSALGYLGAFAPIWEFLVSTSTWWLSGATVFSGLIAPEIGGAVETWATRLAIAVAVLFVSIAVVKVAKGARRSFGGRDQATVRIGDRGVILLVAAVLFSAALVAFPDAVAGALEGAWAFVAGLLVGLLEWLLDLATGEVPA